MLFRSDANNRRIAASASTAAQARSGSSAPPLPCRFGENPENIPIQRRGAVFGILRRDKEFLAKSISAVAIFPCEGARDAESERALAAALEKGGGERVTRLYRRGDVPEEQCWLKGPDWCLAYA